MLSLKQYGDKIIIKIRQGDTHLSSAFMSVVVEEDTLRILKNTTDELQYDKPANVFVATFTALNSEILNMYRKMNR